MSERDTKNLKIPQEIKELISQEGFGDIELQDIDVCTVDESENSNIITFATCIEDDNILEWKLKDGMYYLYLNNELLNVSS